MAKWYYGIGLENRWLTGIKGLNIFEQSDVFFRNGRKSNLLFLVGPFYRVGKIILACDYNIDKIIELMYN